MKFRNFLFLILFFCSSFAFATDELDDFRTVNKAEWRLIKNDQRQKIKIWTKNEDDTTGADFFIDDYTMGGYFGQALFKIDIDKPWCKTFEVGGKFENTDPNTFVSNNNNDYTTITGNIGFTFLPDNMAHYSLLISSSETAQ